MINVEYDNSKVSEAVRDIVSRVTGIEDVFTYTNSAEIKVKIAPIEVFVRMTKKKIKDEDSLIKQIKEEISKWKKMSAFRHPINLTLIPMDWKVEIGI